MTDNKHPITPPPELVRDWIADWSLGDSWAQVCQNVALVAARWGADQELEACCEWADATGWYGAGDMLCAARRSKLPSLKEQALEALDRMDQLPTAEDQHIIRRALEALPE